MRLETSSYYALGIPIFGALMLLEALVEKRFKTSVFRAADDLGNLACGMGQILAGLFLGPLMLALYEIGYELRVCSLSIHSVWTWAFALVAVDLCYYFYHRAGHTIAVFYAVHGVHHQSDDLNIAVALRQPYVSDLYAIFFYFPLPLLGVPEPVFFASVAILSLNQVTLHSRVFSRPSFGIFNTPALHALHHAKNAPYLGSNYGATFIVWDRLFGTYRAPTVENPPQIGAPEGYTTHDSVASQWRGFAELGARVREARGTLAKARVLFGPPSDDVSRAPRAIESRRVARPITRYALVQFCATTSVAAVCLVYQINLSRLVLLASVAALLFAYSTEGRMFDGKLRGERVRLFAMTILGAVLLAIPSLRIVAFVVLAWTVTCLVAWNLLLRRSRESILRIESDGSR